MGLDLDDDTLAAATGINLGLTRVGVFVGPTYTLLKQREDVDHSGAVTPLDALLVIDYLDGDRSPPAAVVSAAEAEAGEPPTYDVNADGVVTPLDVLLVVDYLNRPLSAAGEGEAGTAVVLAPSPIVIPTLQSALPGWHR